jgi:DNA-binding MarR family transcriptional regulator
MTHRIAHNSIVRNIIGDRNFVIELCAIDCMRPSAHDDPRAGNARLRSEEVEMAKKSLTEAHLLLGNQLCFAVYSTAHAINRVYKPLLDRLGLTYPQYLAMLVLWERDGLTVKEIGERLFLDSGTLTPLLKRLEAAHLIRRSRSSEDERQVLVALTAQGQALREKAKAMPAALLAASGCSIGELTSLRKSLLTLREQLDAAVAMGE